MNPPRIKMDFYCDIASTFSYFALEQLLRYEQLWNIELDIHPVYLASIFKITGNRPPIMGSPQKVVYTMKDTARLSQEYQAPFRTGPEFPGNTLRVMKLLRYLKERLPREKFNQAVRHYFRENFVANTRISSPEFLSSLPADIYPAEELAQAIQESQSKEISEIMRSESNALVEEHSAFGFPWIIVTRTTPQGKMESESWFGSDRFSNISWWLGPEYPWLGPTPSKSRL
ncbi:related to Glutathione S-transferase, mitochondrial [Serendipita indica DSM 11827]|uniref:Glutathione S-transferase kappa n=1 Tax=Serendipita indica (strain DSM 11827) TaxID=1109443 RepID=G4TGQ7_SERID|nr:related to Glutathione S-transferase, mitochondrial [Serendipita indica DSM 11827]